MEIGTTNGHTKGYLSVLSYLDGRVVRIVNPIDTRTNIHCHGAGGRAVFEMGGSLLKGFIHMGNIGIGLRINHDMEGIKALGKSHCGQKDPQQQKSAHVV